MVSSIWRFSAFSNSSRSWNRSSISTFTYQAVIGSYTRFFFISNTFISKARLKLAKKSSKCWGTRWGWTFVIWKLSTFFNHIIKTIGHILKNKTKKKCVCVHKITRLIITKMKMKIKSRSYRKDINRPRSRHGHKQSVSVWWCLYVLSNT